MPELSFHRLPLHNENLLTKWLVNIRRVNTPVNEYSRVCSVHFEGGKKKGKDDVPTIFAWSNTITPRPPPKEQDNCDAIKFYTGFPSFQLLMACFTFLGPAVSRLSYEDHIKLTKGKPHKLSPLNEFFFDVVSSATWFI